MTHWHDLTADEREERKGPLSGRMDLWQANYRRSNELVDRIRKTSKKAAKIANSLPLGDFLINTDEEIINYCMEVAE